MNVESKVLDATNNTVLLSITGKVKLGQMDPLVKELSKLIQGRAVKLILNVQDVDAIDSSGIGEIVRARTEMAERGGRVVLLGSNSRVEMMMKLSGLIHIFPVASTQDQAIEMLNQPEPEPPAEPEEPATEEQQ